MGRGATPRPRDSQDDASGCPVGDPPQLKSDLRPEEWKEVTDLMAKVTDIVGTRFSEVLSNVEPDPPGHA